MSLWSKPISQINFADVDAFCQKMQPEGARLDYKGIAFPKDLAKTIAAFANTLGGLIILGVDALETENTPIWPPTSGMPMTAGISERVVQISQESIHPPVRVDVSNVIHNDRHPNHAIVVIRVYESREAPHATEKNSRVYVYDRTSNTSEPYDLADIARIEYMLDRRKRLVDQRELDLRESLARAAKVMHPSICPIRWISIGPVYPWRQVHDQYDCRVFHERNRWALYRGHPTYQTLPGGSFSKLRAEREGGGMLCMGCSSVSANGTLFGIGYAQETLRENTTLFSRNEPEKPGNMWVDMDHYRKMIGAFLENAKSFCSLSKEPPGEVMLSVGMKNAGGVLMRDTFSDQKTDTEFPDPNYRVDLVVQVQQLGLRMPEIDELYNDIIFAFNANALPHR